MMKYLGLILFLASPAIATAQQCSSWGTSSQRAVVRSRQFIQQAPPVIYQQTPPVVIQPAPPITMRTTTIQQAPPVVYYREVPQEVIVYRNVPMYAPPVRYITMQAVPVPTTVYTPVVVTERAPWTPVRGAVRGFFRGY